MADTYQFKYDTGKNMVRFFGWSSALLLVLMIFFPAMIIPLAVAVSFTGLYFIKTARDYSAILLYADRIQIVDLAGRVEMEVYFSNISHIGFLHEEFIIMPSDGSEEQKIDGEDYDGIHDVFTFIKQKIGQE